MHHFTRDGMLLLSGSHRNGQGVTKERLLQPAACLALVDLALTDEQTHNECDEHQEGAAHKGCPCTPIVCVTHVKI